MLSVLQPWASLIVLGLKRFETRGWGCAHRGRLLIHASRSDRGLVVSAEHAAIRRALEEKGLMLQSLPRGQVIGEVSLDEILPLSSVDHSDLAAFGWLVDGPLVWRLSGPQAWGEPIPAVGHTGLWWLKKSDSTAAAPRVL